MSEITTTTTKELLDQTAQQLQQIEERTEFAIAVTTKAIRTQAAVAQGKLLISLKEQVPEGEWTRFFQRADVVVKHNQALALMRTATAYESGSARFGEDLLGEFGATALSELATLPEAAVNRVLTGAQQTGQTPTSKDLRELKRDPQVQVEKCVEDLAAAEERKLVADERVLDVRTDPDVTPKSREYNAAFMAARSADQSVEKLQKRLADLEQQLEQKDLEQQRMERENESLKFDDESVRQQRINRTGNQLILTVPSLLADLQKFVAEKEHYPERVQESVSGPINNLMEFLEKNFKDA